MSGPRIGDANATVEADFAVDHQEFAMRPVVHPGDRVPAQRIVTAYLDPRRLHLLDVRFVDIAAAEPIEHDMHANAGTRPLGQCLCELLTNGAGPIDVRLEGNRLLRAADRF